MTFVEYDCFSVLVAIYIKKMDTRQVRADSTYKDIADITDKNLGYYNDNSDATKKALSTLANKVKTVILFKSFTIKSNPSFKNNLSIFDGKEMKPLSSRDCVDLLNAQHEEIQKLKSERDFYKEHCESEGLLYD